MAASAEAAVEDLEKEGASIMEPQKKPAPTPEPARLAVDTGASTNRADSVTEDITGGDLQINTEGNANAGERPLLTNTVK